MSLSKSSSNFILTLNETTLEFYQDIFNYLTGLSQFQYILVTEHIGQENKHYHIFVQYKRTKRLSMANLHGAHLEKSFGSAQKNIEYLKCEDKKHRDAGITYILIDEKGEPLLKGGNWTIKRLRECDDEAEIPAHLINLKRRLVQEEEADIDIEDLHKNVKVYYIQGPSGIGKTEKAKQIVRDEKENYGTKVNFLKFDGNFWHGVGYNAKVAIYDDFRDSHMKPSEFIHFIDYNKHFLNIKGGNKLNNYELIIITSVQKLDRLYRNMNDEEPKKQWERRIQLIDMYGPDPVFLGGLNLGYRTEFNELEHYNPHTSTLTEVEVTDSWDDTHVIIH